MFMMHRLLRRSRHCVSLIGACVTYAPSHRMSWFILTIQVRKYKMTVKSHDARLGKIETRLAAIEVHQSETYKTFFNHISASKDCAEEVRKELAKINSWAQRREGATKALMWVAGVVGGMTAFFGGLWVMLTGGK